MINYDDNDNGCNCDHTFDNTFDKTILNIILTTITYK